jgi:hypothetical protein
MVSQPIPMKHEDVMMSRYSHSAGAALLMLGAALLLLMTGCNKAERCTWDSDCADDEQCFVGGGAVFGGGKCIPTRAQVAADASDGGMPEVGQPCAPDRIGEQCTAGSGDCRAIGVFVCRSDTLVCNATPDPPGAEVCDGRDNDCDGRTDESLQKACQRQQGVCQGSTVECTNGGFPSCGTIQYGSNFVSAETDAHCDDQDNDCDGTVDEGCECQPGDIRNCGSSTGACTLGMQRCTNGTFGTCQGAQMPAKETCDGEDNDCDGTIDEGCDCVYNSPEGNQGVCQEGTIDGQGNCQPPSTYTGSEQNDCDGEDNDCDGAVDEGCECDYQSKADGVCGDSTRDANGNCQAPANYESPETSCDGLDNNCDGSVDESLEADCSNQMGVCAGSTIDCSTKRMGGDCAAPQYGSAYEPDEETCDGRDNDCDGMIDEGCDDDGDDFCDADMSVAGTPAVCPKSAAGQADDCDDTDAQVNPSANEVCDNDVDDNCSGMTDCADPTCDTQACGTGAGAVCRNDDCVEETCDDGVDNDSDSQTDCADPDCTDEICAQPGSKCVSFSNACQESNCNDGLDNDDDGDIDFDDPDCP